MNLLHRLLARAGHWQGHVPLARASVPRRSGWFLGVNGGSHDAGAALVEVRDGRARLVLNAEEERFSRRKHDWGAPTHSLAEVLRTLEAHGASPEHLVARAVGWDFPAFAAHFTSEVLRGFPASADLLRHGGLLDARVARRLPSLVDDALGSSAPLVAVPHHDAHAWGSLLVSPLHDAGQDVLVVVIDGMGDRGALSLYLAERGREPRAFLADDSLFDSLGLLYQVLSSTQGGWTPLASEGRFMGASAWGERDRDKNPFYLGLRPMLDLRPDGRVRLDRRYMRWHRTPSQPYGAALREVLGPPIPAERLWDPDAVLDPHDQRVPELTRARLDKAAAVQLLFEDAVQHVIERGLEHTGARAVVWTGGTALNAVAAMHLAEARPDITWWTPPFPGDNGIAAGAALRVAWASGTVEMVEPLQHAFLGGGTLTDPTITAALDRHSELRAEILPADGVAERMASLLADGAILGLAQGAAETGPRALGHRSILADATRADALARINAHVKRRESVRPLAPMLLADEARRRFHLSAGTELGDLHAWRWMVRCARARPGTAEVLPAVVHVDGSSRIQIVDPDVDPLCAAILEGLRRRVGVACAVNTSLNVGEPIAHTAEDVLNTLTRARDLHGVVLVGDSGRGWLVRRR